ncbi:MAG TPA: hypothetical protein VG324_18980, partial [Blastocatellia bacterium]|nr:hypothetical protein [Blastocatellia bacterium]
RRPDRKILFFGPTFFCLAGSVGGAGSYVDSAADLAPPRSKKWAGVKSKHVRPVQYRWTKKEKDNA